MNVFERFVSLVFAIGMCVIAGQAMAFDLGGMMKEAQKAVQQQEPINNSQKPAKQSAQPAVASLALPTKQTALPASSSQQTADVKVPNYIETSEPLEMKGIKIGMTVQELLKLYPQGQVMTPQPDTANYILGDQIVAYISKRPTSSPTDCSETNKPCTPVTVLQVSANEMMMIFVNNKLVKGWISLPPITSKIEAFSENGQFYEAILKGLATKLKAEPTKKYSNKSDAYHECSYRTVGWSNNSSKSKLTLLEDINFDRQSYTGNILNMVKIHFLSDEYEKILEDRKKTFSALAEKAEAGKDAKAKKDM